MLPQEPGHLYDEAWQSGGGEPILYLLYRLYLLYLTHYSDCQAQLTY